VHMVSPQAMRAWAKGARPGESMIYLTAPAMVQCAASRSAAAMFREGLVDLTSEPRGDCAGRNWLIVRLTASGKPARSSVGDPATAKIYATLRRRAAAGKACPSLAELARIAGLATRYQAAWRLEKLEAAGRIRSEVIMAARGAVRVVEICSNGDRTADPAPQPEER
jgi:hypothetical protein